MAGGYPVFGGKIHQQGNVFHPLVLHPDELPSVTFLF
jgi:hypothetical protein